jgi:hypothetical protein
MWAWMGALTSSLWFARTVVWAFLVDRIIRTVIEKADVKDLPEVLLGLGMLAGKLSVPGRPALQTAVSGETVADGAKIRAGPPDEAR